jgi:hypothetical protein
MAVSSSLFGDSMSNQDNGHNDLRTAVIAAAIAAVATVAGALGATYLANQNAQQLAETQFEKERLTDRLEVRRNAYIEMLQLFDSYIAYIQEIPQVSSKSTHAKKLQDIRYKAGNAYDVIVLVGNEKAEQLSHRLLTVLNGVTVNESDERVDKVMQEAVSLFTQFADAADQDLQTIR